MVLGHCNHHVWNVSDVAPLVNIYIFYNPLDVGTKKFDSSTCSHFEFRNGGEKRGVFQSKLEFYQKGMSFREFQKRACDK